MLPGRTFRMIIRSKGKLPYKEVLYRRGHLKPYNALQVRPVCWIVSEHRSCSKIFITKSQVVQFQPNSKHHERASGAALRAGDRRRLFAERNNDAAPNTRILNLKIIELFANVCGKLVSILRLSGNSFALSFPKLQASIHEQGTFLIFVIKLKIKIGFMCYNFCITVCRLQSQLKHLRKYL